MEVLFVRVERGLHDLVLSAPGTRYPLYRYIFKWLSGIRSLQSAFSGSSTNVSAA